MTLCQKTGSEDLHQQHEETAGTLFPYVQMFSQFQGLGRKSSLRHSMTAQLIYTSRKNLMRMIKLDLISQKYSITSATSLLLSSGVGGE